eukprot:2926583-Rhodomonas_salina.2
MASLPLQRMLHMCDTSKRPAFVRTWRQEKTCQTCDADANEDGERCQMQTGSERRVEGPCKR